MSGETRSHQLRVLLATGSHENNRKSFARWTLWFTPQLFFKIWPGFPAILQSSYRASSDGTRKRPLPLRRLTMFA
jgi:hypothetical protein